MMMMRSALVLGVMLGGAGDVSAQIAVPPGCVALAAREGFPTDSLTKIQFARARLRLARLNKTDPLVVQCREAIEVARRGGQEHAGN